MVLKPSELTPLSVLRLAELTADVLPPGVLNVVTGRGEAAGVALVEHPAVAMISLTGSVPTGQAIMRAAATTLKRVHLELGGKAPVVVLDDADPEVVAAAVRLGGFFNAGQDCTAACRVIASVRSRRWWPAARPTRRPSSARWCRPGNGNGWRGLSTGPWGAAPRC